MKDERDEFIPSWPQTAAPSGSNGGILGLLAEPDVEPWNDPRLVTPPEMSWNPTRPLYPFLRPPSTWDSSSPPLRHMPVGADTGFPAPPAEPAIAPWKDLRRVPLTALLPFSLPATFSPAPTPEHLDSGKYWPVATASSGANEQSPAHGFYFPPVPQASSWDRVPTNAGTTGLAQMFSQPPSPTSWSTPGPDVNTASYSQADELAMAQQAYDAGAQRMARGVRGRATAPYEPPARDPSAAAGEPGLTERIRLNGVDSFYRGTLMGAGNLALMQHYAATPDEPGIDSQTKRWRSTAQGISGRGRRSRALRPDALVRESG